MGKWYFLLTLLIVASRNVRGDEPGRSLDWLQKLTFWIHRNGEADPCGSASLPFATIKHETLQQVSNKYQMETFLTNAVHRSLGERNGCAPTDDSGMEAEEGIFPYCDMGPDRTPVLVDHDDLVATQNESLPCRWYTREGQRIVSMAQLHTLTDEIQKVEAGTCSNPQEGDDCNTNFEFHMYAVPAGRVFMFAPAYVGEIFDLSHLTNIPEPKNKVYMEVLSTAPRVFDVFNVFTKTQADAVVKRAIEETSPSHKMKRSTTGSSERSIFSKRTSENAFDTHGQTSVEVKKTIFELLGYDEYITGHDDGLQVLRYNKTTAYVEHMDYLTDRSDKDIFNFDSAGKGGNRFATVLLYMTDIPEGGGGETVFSRAWPGNVPVEDRVELSDALEAVRSNGELEAAGIKQGSWEEEMVARCRTRMAIKPHRGRAVLFYSQEPDGRRDELSKHGGCPVLLGEKWAANLWVWNTPRRNFKGQPLREDLLALGYEAPEAVTSEQLNAVFKNIKNDPAMRNAELWYDDGLFWGKLGPQEEHRVNTFEGHRWNIRVDGEVVKRFSMGPEKLQHYEI